MNLPIARYREEIVQILEDSQILVLSGETGWYALFFVLYGMSDKSSVGSLLKFHRFCSKISFPRESIVKLSALSRVVFLLYLLLSECPKNLGKHRELADLCHLWSDIQLDWRVILIRILA